VAVTSGSGSPLSSTRWQDIPAPDVSALCAACHELSQTAARSRGRRGAAAPAGCALGEARATPSGLFRYARIDRLDREAADLALLAPASGRASPSPRMPWTRWYSAPTLSLLRPGYGKVTWTWPRGQPGGRPGDVSVAAPKAEERAGRRGSSAAGTSAPRSSSGSTCGPWPPSGTTRCRPRRWPTSSPKPSSLSPPGRADQEGPLSTVSERRPGSAFTVPHFGKFAALPARLVLGARMRCPDERGVTGLEPARWRWPAA